MCSFSIVTNIFNTDHLEVLRFLYIQENASERARKIFGELDVNGDGELDCEEFVKGCMEDKDLLQTLNGGDVKAQDGQRKRGSTNHKTNLQFEL